MQSLHDITLHYITLHDIAIHDVTLHYITYINTTHIMYICIYIWHVYLLESADPLDLLKEHEVCPSPLPCEPAESFSVCEHLKPEESMQEELRHKPFQMVFMGSGHMTHRIRQLVNMIH